jgi:hypothetical protein
MKQKVRILLAYFRGMGVDRVNTYINFLYDRIEDWNEGFQDGSGNEIKPTDSIVQIVEDLIKYKMNDFHKENEYDYDEYWTLFINIYPNENRINFQSECRFQDEQEYEYDIDLTLSDEMSRTGDNNTLPQQILDKINKTFESEVDEEDEMVSYTFDASNQEIYLNDFYVESIKYDNVRLHPWSDLLDIIMRNLLDRWWSDEAGTYGTIKIIKDKNLTIDCNFRSQDYEMTDMNINVTPDSFK